MAVLLAEAEGDHKGRKAEANTIHNRFERDDRRDLLAKKRGAGTYKVGRILRELAAAGYYTRTRRQGEHNKFAWENVIHEEPVRTTATGVPSAEKRPMAQPSIGRPSSEAPSAENRTILSKTDRSETEKSKTDPERVDKSTWDRSRNQNRTRVPTAREQRHAERTEREQEARAPKGLQPIRDILASLPIGRAQPENPARRAEGAGVHPLATAHEKAFQNGASGAADNGSESETDSSDRPK